MKTHMSLYFSLFLLSTVLRGQAVLEINNFEAYEEDLQLIEAAEFRDSFLRITPAMPNVLGACWYQKERIDLKNGFDTEFAFRISGQDKALGGGDGFAFVIHDMDLGVIGSGGEGLGYRGLEKAVVIEFDTYNNEEGSKNHVNISYFDPKLKRFKRHATVHEIREISDGRPHFARVEYKDGFLTFFHDSYDFPVLSSRLDLAQILGSDDLSAWMGFTSSTSAAYANHDILKWTYKKNIPPPKIDEEKIAVDLKETIEIKNRKIKLKVWDSGKKIDGDVVSIKLGDEWILSEYQLRRKPLYIDLTITGFGETLTLFANNIGLYPPNTASIAIVDGNDEHLVELEADLRSSEAIRVQYTGPMK